MKENAGLVSYLVTYQTDYAQSSYMIPGRVVFLWIPPFFIKNKQTVFWGARCACVWTCHTIRRGIFNAVKSVFIFAWNRTDCEPVIAEVAYFSLWWVDRSLTWNDRGFVCFSLMYRELSRNMWRTGLDVFQENTYIENRLLYMWLPFFGIAKVKTLHPCVIFLMYLPSYTLWLLGQAQLLEECVFPAK